MKIALCNHKMTLKYNNQEKEWSYLVERKSRIMSFSSKAVRRVRILQSNRKRAESYLLRYGKFKNKMYADSMPTRVFQNSTTKKIWKSDTKESAPADTEQSPHLFTLCTKTEKLEYRAVIMFGLVWKAIMLSALT